MNEEKLVSIIMPAYNAGNYIEASIKSVIEQSYSSWELIVVNDGSTDETAALLGKFTDTRIKRIDQSNRGVSAARNAALDIAQGEFITLLDADDKLPPESLELRLRYLLENPAVDIVDGILVFMDNELVNEFKRHVPSYTGSLFERLLRLDSKVFCLPMFMFRSRLLKGLRFDESMTHSEDLMFYISLSSEQSVQYGYVSELVYLYRTGHGSAMSNMAGLERGYFQVLEKLKRFSMVTLLDHCFLRLKIAKILFLCWVADRKPGRAITAAWTALAGGYR